MLQVPTGGGKTRIASAIIESALAKGKRVGFVAPAVSLIQQTIDSFKELGITEVGGIQANNYRFEPEKPVQVCSIHTLKGRGQKGIPHMDLVIVDEAHINNVFLHGWMDSWNAVPFIGLSATPWTKGLGKVFDDLVRPVSMHDLIEKGILSDYDVLAPFVPDLAEVKVSCGDYNEKELSTFMGSKEIVADIVRTYKTRWNLGKTLCFCVDRAHAKRVQEDFEAAGVTVGYIDAFTEVGERQHIEDCFHAGHIDVVCNVGCLTTGIDWDVRCLILARPTKSEMLFVQIVGRVLRSADGKDKALILDHSGNFLTLGRPEEIQYDHLHDGTRHETMDRKKLAEDRDKPKQCSKCGTVKDEHECPSCGFAPQKQTDVIVHAGELVELRHARDVQREFAEMLEHYRQEKGKPHGFVRHEMVKKFGEKLQMPSNIQPRPPNDEVKRYIKYINIRNAKFMQKQAKALHGYR
jgi:superfamily II DNA or RNA helicase